MANLSALVDKLLHPDIPFFDIEHIVVGGVTALVAILLYIGLTRMAKRTTLAQERLREHEEEALRESEHRFDQLAAQSRTFTWEVDTQGLYTFVSRVTEPVLGYRPEEIVGRMHFYDLHPESGRDEFKAAAFAVFERKEPFQDLPNAIQAKDGRLLWVSTTGLPLIDADGTLRGYRGSDTDISERKRAEEELALAAERTRLVLDSAAEGILGLDLQGRHTFINPAAARMLGHEAEELVGRQSHSTWHHSRRDGSPYPRNECPIYAAYRDGEVHRTSDEVFWRKDGTSFPVEYASTPIIRDGRAAGAVVTFTDITERMRAEEALRESEARHRLLFDSSQDALMTLSPPSWQFDFGNPAAMAMFGARDEADFASRAPWQYSPERQPDGRESGEMAMEMIGTAMREGSNSFEWTHRRADGADFPATVLLTRTEIAGETILQATVRDITALKQAEAEAAKSEARVRRLQKAESLGRMAGAIAHHFNNKLQAVQLNLEMAADELAPGSGPALKVSEAVLAAKQASEVSTLMLTYLGQTHGMRESLDLSAACGRWLALLEAAAPKDVVLVSDLASQGPRVHADADRMRQVLSHLVTNAWEAGGAGRGEIRVSVKAVTLAAIRLGHCFPSDWQPLGPSYACLEVVDHGSGIAEADIEKIFDPFFSSKFTGRGMGLAVVLGIVRAHDGAVTVESTVGGGSTFRVYLPAS